MNGELRRRVIEARDQDARREMAAAGGYRKVETDLRGQDLRIARSAEGAPTYVELQERVVELETQLKRARSRISTLRASRELWYVRATGRTRKQRGERAVA